jgi:glutathione S-transferase
MIGQGVLDAPHEASRATTAFVHFYIRSAHDEGFRAQQEKTTRSFIEHLEKGFEATLGRKLNANERRLAPTLVAACLEGMSLFAIIFKDRESLKAAWKAMSQWIAAYLEE